MNRDFKTIGIDFEFKGFHGYRTFLVVEELPISVLVGADLLQFTNTVIDFNEDRLSVVIPSQALGEVSEIKLDGDRAKRPDRWTLKKDQASEKFVCRFGLFVDRG